MPMNHKSSNLVNFVKNVVVGCIEEGNAMVNYRNRVRVEPVGYNSCNVITEISPFVLNYGRKNFLFPSTEIILGVSDILGEGHIEKPRVTKGYRHPFVYSDGSICFDDGHEEEHWKFNGVSFQPFSNYERMSFAKMAARAVFYTHRVLAQGYRKGVAPVHDLTELEFPIERIRGLIYE